MAARRLALLAGCGGVGCCALQLPTGSAVDAAVRSRCNIDCCASAFSAFLFLGRLLFLSRLCLLAAVAQQSMLQAGRAATSTAAGFFFVLFLSCVLFVSRIRLAGAVAQQSMLQRGLSATSTVGYQAWLWVMVVVAGYGCRS